MGLETLVEKQERSVMDLLRKLEAKIAHMTTVITAFADIDDAENVHDVEKHLEEWNDALDKVKACRRPKQGE